jgi:polyisoprenoid-binding protein YceI
MLKQLLITSLLAVSSGAFSQSNYTLDKNHSRLAFTATHFAISHVEGNFKNFDVTLKTSKEDFTDAVISMTADATSVNTDVDMRDKDLRSANWFDVEKFPKIEFKSTAFKKISDKHYKLEGTITIHGVTKPIVFDVTYNGKALNPMSKKNSLGFTLTGKLNRKDFGVGTEAFEGVVGKEIELRSNVEFIID